MLWGELELGDKKGIKNRSFFNYMKGDKRNFLLMEMTERKLVKQHEKGLLTFESAV